ncbi:winged helix-turn-helix transcriptional regulator [Candidatus Calescamantes bacterium]|nr:winged helix-turn-helix transcriptional regulator [Candidatus Calescamantes bacterium]
MEKVTLFKGSKIKPKYKLLVNELSRDILNGTYHHRMPGLRELARKHQVHLKTMAKAVNILVEKGLLYREKGIGTFINEQIVKNKLLTIWLLSEKEVSQKRQKR